MNYFYTPVLEDVETYITLNSFPPLGDVSEHGEGFFIYQAWPEGHEWCLHSQGRLESYDSVNLAVLEEGSTFPTDPLFCFLYPETLPDRLNKLPVAPIMNTPVMWRANLQFRSAGSVTSFQAEYPDSMLKIPVGSLASFSPMVQTGEQVRSKLIVVNIRETPERERRDLIVMRLRSKERVLETDVWTNTCNVVDLDSIEYSQSDPIGVFSPNMAGIPLYFTLDEVTGSMSFEHTHPPLSSMFFGEGRQEMVGEMKRYWMEILQNAAN